MPIEYDVPEDLLYDGAGLPPLNEIRKKVDLRPFIVSTESVKDKDVRDGGSLVILRFEGASSMTAKGAIKLFVATNAKFPGEGSKHTIQSVTVPPEKSVKITTPKRRPGNYSILVGVQDTRNRLKWAGIGGGAGGVAGAGAGQVTMERPEVGVITAIGGAIGGWFWEGSKYSEYSAETVEE